MYLLYLGLKVCSSLFHKIDPVRRKVYHFYTPVKDGTYYGITRGGRPGGRVASSSLSGAYLQNYST